MEAENRKDIFMQVINKERLYEIVNQIREQTDVKEGEVLVLTVDPQNSSVDDIIRYSNKFFIFYEMDKESNQRQRGALIHKKMRTFYTINALNVLILQLTGEIDKNYKVDWQEYSNSLMISNKDNELQIIKTKFYKKI